MPCPHNEITIVQRSQRQSAVAAAAYQSGEKLFCEYDQQVKHYPEKRGIVHNEILLPANAPQEYADRNTLWNAAEAVEKQWNSQLARRWVLTIPREIPPDQYAVLVREFCEQQFVSKGMIADFAIHDPHPPGHNPHAHVLLTMRAMDEHGKWLPKSRKVYDLDENGERIKLPSGRWKSHKEDTVDWNDQKYCEIWRHEWEVIQNRYLDANDRPERVDLRSYARQGLDIVPTVHEGTAVRQMEKRGIQTNIGNLNREIRAANRLMKSIRQLIQNLKGWITELGEKRKELLAQKAAEEATLLPNLLMKYMEIRKEERKDWTRAGQNRGTSQDLKAVSEALSYLRQKGLSTVEDLEAFLESSGKSAADYRNQMKPKEARSKVIDGILASRTDCKECKAVYEKYQKIFFKKIKGKFKQEHPEVARYEKAADYLAKHPDDKDKTKNELQQEQETLLSEIAELKVPLTEVQEDLKKVHSSYLVSARKGMFTGTVAPFGYRKDPDQHGHLLIDEETAPIVRDIFQLAAEGHGPNFIRRRLEDAKVPTPAWWGRHRGLRNLPLTRWEKIDPENGKYMWDFSVIKDLLINPVYTGAVSSQKRNYRFKIGTINDKKPEDWIVVEGCHEPIIDKATFEIVQEKLKSRQRPQDNGEFSLFAGLIKCGECGKALTHRLAYAHEPLPVYCCKTYNAFGKGHCTQHRVTEPMLKEIVLNKIRECARAAQVDDDDVAKRLRETCETEQRQRQEALAHAIAKDEERLDALGKMVMQLYEDRMLKHITEENFTILMAKTQQEQAEVQARIDATKKSLNGEAQIAYDTQQWKEAISQYADIQELDAATLNRLVKAIIVHEKIDDGERHITIEIHFNLQPMPEIQRLESASYASMKKRSCSF